MGQYHHPVCLDLEEYLYPHELGDGLKLMEFGSSGHGTMAALGLLLAPEGRWHGHRIAIVGDYGEPGDLRPEIEAEFGHAGLIYGRCSDTEPDEDQREWWEDRSVPLPTNYANQRDLVYPLMVGVGFWASEPERGGGYARPEYGAVRDDGPECLIVNLDKGAVIDPAELGDSRNLFSFIDDCFGGAMTALAVLLGASNGKGGGDFCGEDPNRLVGSWAGDRLAIVTAQHAENEGWDLAAAGSTLRDLLVNGNEAKYLTCADGSIKRTRWEA